jgi:signal transduction histidine kinase
MDTRRASALASQKRRASKSGEQDRSFDHLIAKLCRAFVRATVEEIDEEINRWLKRIVLALGLDRATVAELDSSGWGAFSHGWARDPDQIIEQPLDINALLPWLLNKVAAGETVIIPSLDDLPEEAAIDRESFRRHGTKSNVTLPIRTGGEVVGGVGFATMYRERKWPAAVVEQLRLVAEIFGYALERKKSVGEIHRLRDELTHVSRITTVGQLATSIAHELNQPLAAVMNNAEACQIYLASDHPNFEAVRMSLEGIVSDTQRASDILGRFRQLFKRRELRSSTLSPDELFDAVERILRSRATTLGVSLLFGLAPSLPYFTVDRILIQQVLINLILNAFDSVCATGEGPREVEVSASKGEPGFIHFAVQDTGTGIQPHLMLRLFESFFTTKPEGLGIGLAISRSIVEAHGGSMWAKRNPDRGATFEFTLPTAAAKQASLH